MINILELNQYLKDLLDPKGIADIGFNGIQVECEGKISKIAFSVDASYESIIQARAAHCQLLIVHHGFYWGKIIPITGMHRQRIKTLLEANIGLIAYHLPLDSHENL
ncbi:MAG: Nif3-like dinuclear metal center hexameric protein, partial [Spirochaetes bacterium]|nr:Nif3-like dinuclear metal center hexameric protein [Spirochaetota bacterium]